MIQNTMPLPQKDYLQALQEHVHHNIPTVKSLRGVQRNIQLTPQQYRKHLRTRSIDLYPKWANTQALFYKQKKWPSHLYLKVTLLFMTKRRPQPLAGYDQAPSKDCTTRCFYKSTNWLSRPTTFNITPFQHLRW